MLLRTQLAYKLKGFFSFKLFFALVCVSVAKQLLAQKNWIDLSQNFINPTT